MPLTEDERSQLIEYISHRTCEEFRRGEPCIDRKQQDNLVEGQHPGCRQARDMIALVRRA